MTTSSVIDTPLDGKPQDKSITIEAAQLHRILVSVPPMTSTVPTFPVLGTVQLSLDGSTLTATATDRYTVGVCRTTIEPSGSIDEWTVMITRDDVKSLITDLKRAPGRVRVTVTDTTLALDEWRTVQLFTGAEFPRVSGPFADALAMKPDRTRSTTLDYTMLAHFGPAAKAAGKTPSGKQGTPVLTMTMTDKKDMILIRCGANFAGILMNMRLPEGKELEAW